MCPVWDGFHYSRFFMLIPRIKYFLPLSRGNNTGRDGKLNAFFDTADIFAAAVFKLTRIILSCFIKFFHMFSIIAV